MIISVHAGKELSKKSIYYKTQQSGQRMELSQLGKIHQKSLTE